MAASGLARACVEVMGSAALALLSKVVLDVGNMMNSGSKAGSASAVKSSVWERVAATKTADGRMSMLEYIGEVCFEVSVGEGMLF